jgi:hypothetical protein
MILPLFAQQPTGLVSFMQGQHSVDYEVQTEGSYLVQKAQKAIPAPLHRAFWRRGRLVCKPVTTLPC